MSDVAATVPAVHEATRLAVAAVMRELAEMEATDAAVAEDLSRRSQREAVGASVAYSPRLDPAEMAALKRRAAAIGIKPSVLARNLIREGLRGGARYDPDYPRSI